MNRLMLNVFQAYQQ